MNKTIESTAAMTNDAPPPYQTDAPPAYSPIPYQALDNPVFYHINRPLSDYEIYSGDEVLSFYVEIRTWNISKADLRFYQGNKDSGQKVAECRYGENMNPSQCDAGWLRQRNASHNLGGKMAVAWWTGSTRDSPRAVQYRFAAMVDQPEMIEQEPIVKTPKTFVWMKSSDLVLLEEETRTIAALVHETTSDPSKCGTLEIIVSYGNDFNLIVLSTLVALFEKQRRHGKRTSRNPGEESLRGKIGGIMGTVKRW
ncbi:hypothetical protein N7541_009451 [Penicillium brevicompactum]|uniref:Uncharacterized protein n=1 Tax=Penicillium brevicompactum TaxID=5074 RepID=A0A9W9UGQ1_PENBR|nr:hypothetical protein N7541_009451 [Penicillium brevicompactum]